MTKQRWQWQATSDPAVIRAAQSDAINIAATLVRLVCDSDHEFAEPVRRGALRLRAIADTLGKNHPVERKESLDAE